jgi:transposase-like protein
MSRGSNPEKLREWTERFERFAKSQQTVARFCGSEGVSQPSFYQWKKKFREQRTAFSRSRQRFQPVDIASVNAKPESTIHLGADIRIELGSDLRITESIVRQLLESVDQHSTGVEPC